MATIFGSYDGDGATILQGNSSEGTQNVTLSDWAFSRQTEPGDNRSVYDISMKGGDDTLEGGNLSGQGARVAFGQVDLGTGDDMAHLSRTTFETISTGDGDDTLKLEQSFGARVDLGKGDDVLWFDMKPDHSLSDANKMRSGAKLDGGKGQDTLNLRGDWTLTLSSGNVTMDTDGDGKADLVTNVYSDSDIGSILAYPRILQGTVSYGTMTLRDGSTVASRSGFANFEAINAVCFTAGTLIDTPRGAVPIETLRQGDTVITRNGPKALAWIGSRRLDAVDLAGNPKLLPILVPAGAFGNGLPLRDIRFSPQHRVVIRSAIAETMFGAPEVLVAVKQLIGVNGIDVDGDARSVQYLHLMFADHQILSVEGIEAESLFPGRQALTFLSQDQLSELRAIFPDFDAMTETDPAIPFLKGREGRSLAARHARNDRPLYS